jgi:hypothetical protein
VRGSLAPRARPRSVAGLLPSPSRKRAPIGLLCSTRRQEEPCSPRAVHLPPAAMPGWLRSARGAVSSTGRAKDF